MRRLWTRVSLCLMVAVLMVGLACTQASPTPTPAATATKVPVSVTDDAGRSVTIQITPERVVSLAPNITEVLFALGLEDKVVGVDNFSDYPEGAKAKEQVGAPFPNFNIEKMVSLQPDLVLAVPGEHIAQLEAQGLTVVVLQPEDLDHVLANIELVGRLTGAEDEAEALTKEMRQRIEAVAAKTKDVARPRVFYEIDATEPAKPWTVGPGSFVDSLIALAGGKNLGAKGASDYFQMSAEEIIKADPEIIILSDSQFGVTAESVAQRPGWAGIAAVKKGAIHPIDDPNLTDRPGPRLVQGLELLARIIHPELFN